MLNNELVNIESMDTKMNKMKVILDQNSEKHINVNKTMLEHFEKLIKKDGNIHNVIMIK